MGVRLGARGDLIVDRINGTIRVLGTERRKHTILRRRGGAVAAGLEKGEGGAKGAFARGVACKGCGERGGGGGGGALGDGGGGAVVRVGVGVVVVEIGDGGVGHGAGGRRMRKGLIKVGLRRRQVTGIGRRNGAKVIPVVHGEKGGALKHVTQKGHGHAEQATRRYSRRQRTAGDGGGGGGGRGGDIIPKAGRGGFGGGWWGCALVNNGGVGQTGKQRRYTVGVWGWLGWLGGVVARNKRHKTSAHGRLGRRARSSTATVRRTHAVGGRGGGAATKGWDERGIKRGARMTSEAALRGAARAMRR
ncbi:basic proline-rich protein [Gracilaria domingensis]|nr:basic proline-rich protein [Gracilaria domingensis]